MLNIPRNCAPIRPSDAHNTIGDNLRILTCANLLNGHMSLSSAKSSAKTLGLEIPFWSWDETIAIFESKGHKVLR
jgi:hypothetical protein